MDERSQRIFSSLLLLAALWVSVYWLWSPAERTPRVTFAEPTAGAAEVGDDPAFTDNRSNGQISLLDPALIQQEDGPRSGGTTLPAATPREPTTPPTDARLVPPRFRNYTVRQGDGTLSDIAGRELGSASRWQVIARANPLKDPNRIKPGDVLKIPLDPSNIQGKVVGEGESIAIEPQPPEIVEYVVQPGDVLSRIAEQYYGTSRFQELIYEFNKDRLRSPNALRVGQVLRLPPAPAED